MIGLSPAAVAVTRGLVLQQALWPWRPGGGACPTRTTRPPTTWTPTASLQTSPAATHEALDKADRQIADDTQ